MSDVKDGKITQNISNVSGSIIAPITTGSDNTIDISQENSHAVIEKLTITDTQLNKIEKEYISSLKNFVEKFNVAVKENNLESKKISEIQIELDGFIDVLQNVTTESGITKKENVRTKFIDLVKKSVKYLPKATQLITSFTPLAPLSPLIGDAVEKIIESIQQEL